MLRLLLAIPAALGAVLLIFTFMAWMVDTGQPPAEAEKPLLAFDMVMVEQDREARRRQRTVPEKPQTPEPPPQALPRAAAHLNSPALSPSLPSLDLDVAASGVSVNVPLFSGFAANQQAMPLYRVEPDYPARAMQRGTQGTS